jgi:hypothetical protein
MDILRKACSLVLVLAALSALGSDIAIGQNQNHMILKKRGLTDRLHFLTGDNIRFIRKENSFEEGGVIQGIGTDYILIAGREVPVSSIGIIIFRRTSFNFDASGKMLMLASPLYLLIGGINSLIQGYHPIWTWGNAGVAASIAAAGLGFSSLQEKKFRLGGKYQLRIVQSDPFFNLRTPNK